MESCKPDLGAAAGFVRLINFDYLRGMGLRYTFVHDGVRKNGKSFPSVMLPWCVDLHSSVDSYSSSCCILRVHFCTCWCDEEWESHFHQ